jgi:DNA-binding YbaB/EbfC family protein
MNKKRSGGGRPGFGSGGFGGGGFGGGGMGNIMSQMQKLQAEMEKTQAELSTEELTVSAGGGAVTIVVTGGREFKSVTLKPEVVNPEDVEMLQDLLLAAFNDALSQAKRLEEERMSGLTGGLGLPPGLF